MALRGEAACVTQDLGEAVVDEVPASPPGESRLVEADASELATGAFVSSLQPRTKFMRLHRNGDCAYRPGGDAKTFVCHGYDEPRPGEYSKKCGHCFKTPAVAASSFGGVFLDGF